MDLMKLQNLLNKCIMIEQGNYLGGNLSVDLAEAQAELDQAKQLLIQRVSNSLPLDELHEWCDTKGTDIGAVLTIRTDNLEDTIINCYSKSSLAEFKDKISNHC